MNTARRSRNQSNSLSSIRWRRGLGERRQVDFFGLPLSSVLSPLLRPPSAVVHHLVSDLPGLLRRTGRWERKKICASCENFYA
jgi:hypothetical protein